MCKTSWTNSLGSKRWKQGSSSRATDAARISSSTVPLSDPPLSVTATTTAMIAEDVPITIETITDKSGAWSEGSHSDDV